MRDGSPAPAPQAHTWITSTDSPHLTRISHHSLDALRFEVRSAAVADGGHSPAAMRLLVALLRAVREDTFAATGRLRCELTVPTLLKSTGLAPRSTGWRRSWWQRG